MTQDSGRPDPVLLRNWFAAAEQDDVPYIKEHMGQCMRCVDGQNRTALMRAITAQAVGTVGVLAEQEGGYLSPLHEAAIFGAVAAESEAALELLKEREYMFQDAQGRNALWLCVEQRWIYGVRALCGLYGSDPSLLQDTQTGETPLLRALELRDTAIVRILVPFQADISGRDGRTPLARAVASDYAEAVAMLLRGSQALFQQIHTMQRLEDLKYFTDHFGHTDSQGRTALMLVAQRHELHTYNNAPPTETADTLVFKLVAREQRRQDVFGRTALMYAAASGNTWLIRYLVSSEAAMTDVDGYSALMHAVLAGNVAAVSALKPYEHNIVNCQGNSALKLAVLVNDRDILQLLSDEAAVAENGALGLAVQRGDCDVVELLAPQFAISTNRQLKDQFEMTDRRDILELMRTQVRSRGRTSVLGKVKRRHNEWDV